MGTQVAHAKPSTDHLLPVIIKILKMTVRAIGTWFGVCDLSLKIAFRSRNT